MNLNSLKLRWARLEIARYRERMQATVNAATQPLQQHQQPWRTAGADEFNTLIGESFYPSQLAAVMRARREREMREVER